MPNRSPILLEVKDLYTHFPTAGGLVRAVDGASFTLHRGETVGLVGESGCGKSVMARSILRIVPPPGTIAGGQILYHRPVGNQSETVDLTALDSDDAMLAIRGLEIAMIFQEPMRPQPGV